MLDDSWNNGFGEGTYKGSHLCLSLLNSLHTFSLRKLEKIIKDLHAYNIEDAFMSDIISVNTMLQYRYIGYPAAHTMS